MEPPNSACAGKSGNRVNILHFLFYGERKPVELREEIQSIIKHRSGIKAVDLALEIMHRVSPSKYDGEIFHKILDELVESGDILRITYTSPSQPDRSLFIFFTKGTILTEFPALQRNVLRNNDHSSQVKLDRESDRDT